MAVVWTRLVAVSLLVCVCAARGSTPPDAATRLIPPPTAAEQRTLDSATHELERKLALGGRLDERGDLNRYLQAVVDRLLGGGSQTATTPVHVRVIKDPEPSAFVLPDGELYVTTALLCDLESEAELASVLSHELTHHTNLHTLRAIREQNSQIKERRTGRLMLGILAGVTIGAVTGVAPFVTENYNVISQESAAIWDLVSVSGYTTALEREADDDGLRRLVAAGYDATAAVTALERLADAAGSSGTTTNSPWASRGKIRERIATCQAVAATQPANAGEMHPFTGRNEYKVALNGIGLAQVVVLINAGALVRAQSLLSAEISHGDSAEAAFLEGEISRRAMPRTDDTEVHALAAYLRATQFPRPIAAAFREAGILYRRRGDRAAAMTAFKAYLERAPNAPDAATVRLYIESMMADDADAASKGGIP